MNNQPDKPTPEQLAALEKIRAKYRSPELRAEHDKIRQTIKTEFPPKSPGKSGPKAK